MTDTQIVQMYLDKATIRAPGSQTKLSTLFDNFQTWLPPAERLNWTKRRFSRALDTTAVVKGRTLSGQIAVANISTPSRVLVRRRDGVLVPQSLREYVAIREGMIAHE